MAAPDLLKRLQIRFAGRDLSKRPFFVPERNWAVFVSFVRNEHNAPELGRIYGFSAERVRQIINEVEHLLSLPRKSEREWLQVTADSPIEDLSVSVRALNQLHDLGCTTVEDVLRLDFSRKPMGPTSRTEVLEALKHSGFAAMATVAPPGNGDIEKVTEQLRELRDRIDDSLRSWKNRVVSIEARLKRIANEGD